MQRKSFEEYKELFMQARQVMNFNDMAVWTTELLKYDNTLPWVWMHRGVALSGLGHPFDAIMNYERALQFDQSELARAEINSNIGAAYWDMFDGARAEYYLLKAIELHPIAQTYLTLGNVYKYRNEWERAINAYRNSVDVNPDYVDGHLVLGMALLKAGRLAEGWKEYEWRWKSEQLPPRKLKCPQWAGEDLTDKNILVYGEQGLGDILQFSRYVRVLSQLFPKARIFLEGRQPVQRLLASIPEAYAVINAGDPVPACDYAVPLLTLAGMLTPDMKSIPAQRQEFLLQQRDIDKWHEKFKQLPEGFRIGLCWAGMSRISNPQAVAVDTLRSATLEQFAPLAKVQDVVFVSLQKGPPAEQVKRPPLGMTIGDFTEEMYDFYDTCCAAANCDLVISVDTAVVHATASVGIPTWVLSRWDGCWRWFGDRPDSPWYPTVRQFVQPKPGDWEGMLDNVAAEVQHLIRSKNQPELNLTLAK